MRPVVFVRATRSLTLRLTVFVSLAIVIGGGFAWPFCVLLRGVIFPVGDWRIHTLALGRAQDAVVNALRRSPDGSAYIEMTGELRDYMARSPGFRFAAFDVISGSPISGSDPRLLAAIMPNENRHSIPARARVVGDPNPSPNYYAYPVAATAIGEVEVALYGYTFQWDDLLRYVSRRIVQIDLPESLPPLVLTIFACWFAVRRGLTPMGAAAKQLAQINLDALNERIPIEGVPDEIAPFISTLNEMLARLETGVARQQRFVANAAHELRTPIAALRARVDNPRDGDWRKDMRRGLRHLQAITEQLLASAKISGRAAEERGRSEPLDLAEVVETKAGDYLPLALENGRSIAFEGPLCTVGVEADRHAVESILSNLLDNALRSDPEGGVVIVRLSSQGVLEVVDHGEGVAADDRDKIFEPFWRKSEAGPGAGLGLAITKELVEKLKGRIWVEETPGGGATFKVSLPKRA